MNIDLKNYNGTFHVPSQQVCNNTSFRLKNEKN